MEVDDCFGSDVKENDKVETTSMDHFRKKLDTFYRPTYSALHLTQHLGTSICCHTDAEEINKMEVNVDDTWVVSFPRSGTTLTQEIVYLISSNLDFKTALSKCLDARFPFLDMPIDRLEGVVNPVMSVKQMSPPRLIKSHFHFHTMPAGVQEKKCKIIYIARNPKDVIQSIYFFLRYMRSNKPELTVEEYLEAFLADATYATPWWRHVKDYWKQRNHENVLFLFYEDLVTNMKENIYKIGQFLGKDLSTDDVSKIAEHCSFQNMKTNPAINSTWQLPAGELIRKGKIGSWKEYFTPEMSRKVERMVEEKLGDTDLTFVYDEYDE